ncbi:hypothetical protein [Saccharomonospora cyanea]|uniref:Uncharacterized protein n=1 Tax=Saccharomonospora cyanea NA-134 TaxID=882082 RepID=H5XG15_9PSEU|nr:hypothetical protein [Saccharomonospora cyanea]EHR61571.1 hypothetical protein SaccyDRAFT_2724 [Saccharomonospora cyanea NA-134]
MDRIDEEIDEEFEQLRRLARLRSDNPVRADELAAGGSRGLGMRFATAALA